MKKILKLSLSIACCLAILALNINWIKQPVNEANYFGETPPSTIPKIFAPNKISDGFGNRDIAISPKGDEMFYTIQHPKGIISAIMFLKKVNGKWTAPEVADFSGMYNDLEPAFSPDGKTIYFSSNRPLSDTGKTKDYDIWSVTKVNGKWSLPKNAGDIINTDKDEYYAAPTKTGNLYFTCDMGDSKEDIVMCKFTNGKYEPAVSLPDAVNSTGYEFNAFVDADETMVIFTGYKRKDDIGGGDLYISFKNADGWSPAKNLGASINSTAIDYCPYVSPDKKYLFFTSSRSTIKSPAASRRNFKQIQASLGNYGNGLDDIYWVSMKDILKP